MPSLMPCVKFWCTHCLLLLQGSIVTGYSARGQAPPQSTAYQQQSSQVSNNSISTLRWAWKQSNYKVKILNSQNTKV